MALADYQSECAYPPKWIYASKALIKQGCIARRSACGRISWRPINSRLRIIRFPATQDQMI
jgi:hypothetical protein